MNRLHAVVLFVAGFAVAGVFSGAVIADVTTATSTTTGVSTTVETTTTTAATTTTAPSRGGILPTGVRIAGIRVAGLPVAEAVAEVQDAFSKQLPVIVDRTTLLLDPTTVANAYAATAVARARISDPGSNVKLAVAVNGPALRQWVAAVQKRFARPAADATLTFKNAKPVIKPAIPGRVIAAK